MGRYIARRTVHGVIVLFGVSIIVFLLMHLAGDPVAVLLPLDAPPEQVEAFRHEMGFDKPLPVQYFYFMSRAVRGDFGYSYHYRIDAMQIVLDRMPATLKLTFGALFVALIVAIPAGILSYALIEYLQTRRIDSLTTITGSLAGPSAAVKVRPSRRGISVSGSSILLLITGIAYCPPDSPSGLSETKSPSGTWSFPLLPPL